jgi:hypothetical protein
MFSDYEIFLVLESLVVVLYPVIALPFVLPALRCHGLGLGLGLRLDVELRLGLGLGLESGKVIRLDVELDLGLGLGLELLGYG